MCFGYNLMDGFWVFGAPEIPDKFSTWAVAQMRVEIVAIPPKEG